MWIFVAMLATATAGSPEPQLAAVDTFAAAKIHARVFPGAVILVGNIDGVEHVGVYGHRVAGGLEPMTRDTIFDLASVTKTIAGTSAVLKLIENEALNLDDKVSTHLAGFHVNHPRLTVEHLLDHSAGLRGGYAIYKDRRRGRKPSPNRSLRHIRSQKAFFEPGEDTRYSDAGYLVVGRVVEAASRKRLDTYLLEEVFAPIGMKDTIYELTPKQRSRTAPTRGVRERGRVHDPITRLSSNRRHQPAHAGLFSTADDLARYARMLLRRGLNDDGKRVFRASTFDFASSRFGWCAGWANEAGDCSAISKVGFTGTYMFIDRAEKFYVVYLSNRTHLNDNRDVFSPDFDRLVDVVRRARTRETRSRNATHGWESNRK